MSDKVPDWCMEEAADVMESPFLRYGRNDPAKAEIAAALLSAYRRGRADMSEEAATVAFDEMFNAVDAIRARKLQTSIRRLGEAE